MLTVASDETDGQHVSAVTGEVCEVTREHLLRVESALSLGPYDFIRDIVDTTAGCAFIFVAKHVTQPARSKIVPSGYWNAIMSESVCESDDESIEACFATLTYHALQKFHP